MNIQFCQANKVMEEDPKSFAHLAFLPEKTLFFLQRKNVYLLFWVDNIFFGNNT